MTTRRQFLKSTAKLAAGAAVASAVPNYLFGAPMKNNEYVSQRPPVNLRKFTSTAVEQALKTTSAKIKDKKLAWMFNNCFPNTLDTTVNYTTNNQQPDTFVITGDINAMWLRDSTAQVWPYLPLMAEDKHLQDMVKGLVFRQTRCILIDPYANAFNPNQEGGQWQTDYTEMKPELHERKWEIDSLCYPVRLAYHYWKKTGDTSIFTTEWQKAMQSIIATFKEQQRKENRGSYYFLRVTDRQGDTLLNKGWGSPVKPVGLIFSAFRPSDDATMFGFLIPSNMFAVTSLEQLSEIYTTVLKDITFANTCKNLADEVNQAIQKYGVVTHEKYGKIYAFEVDGYGNHNCMDDSNIPSLLAIPYLDYCKADDALYQNTRKFIWSLDNPYFFKGSAGEGIGGPHQGIDNIWPMSLIMKAMTSDNPQEMETCLKTLVNTDADTGFIHETFHKDNPKHFTRDWFAWVNTLFGELVLKMSNHYPEVLQKIYSV